MTATIALRKKKPTKAEQQAAREAVQKPDPMLMPGLVAEQQRMLAARDTSQIATLRTVPADGRYLGEQMAPSRPGAQDAMQVPSLVDGQRTQYKPPAAYCVGRSIFTVGTT